MQLILASSSPRRRQLLEEAGMEFEIRPPRDSAECGICSRETPPELVARLAYQKAEDVVQRMDATEPPALVLGADTVAECCGQILGKPADRRHAGEMLRLMQGRSHQVFSGVCLWDTRGQQPLVEVDVARLTMEPVSEAELEAYLDTGAWEGKAGAFGLQDRLGWVRLDEGSESCVVGLPMELLSRMLQRLS